MDTKDADKEGRPRMPIRTKLKEVYRGSTKHRGAVVASTWMASSTGDAEAKALDVVKKGTLTNAKLIWIVRDITIVKFFLRYLGRKLGIR